MKRRVLETLDKTTIVQSERKAAQLMGNLRLLASMREALFRYRYRIMGDKA